MCIYRNPNAPWRFPLSGTMLAAYDRNLSDGGDNRTSL